MSEKALTTRVEERLPLSRPEDIETLRATIARGATDSEMGLFVQVCQRLRLDPFAKQIYLVKRPGQPASIQASIDGLRVVAERSGDYEGQQAPQWCGADGVWRDVWLGKDAPAAAKVGVYRRGFREPMVRIAKLDAYKQPGPFWTRMPEHMLAKVAEALALRAAFPHDLSGIYAPEEMGEHSAESATAAPVSMRVIEAPAAPAAPAPQVIEMKLEPMSQAPATAPAKRKRIKPTTEETEAKIAAIVAQVEEVWPDARKVLDPEEQVQLSGIDPRTQRAVFVRRFAELGVSAADLETYLDHPVVKMTREEGDELTQVLALIRSGQDSWRAIIAQKTAARAE